MFIINVWCKNLKWFLKVSVSFGNLFKLKDFFILVVVMCIVLVILFLMVVFIGDFLVIYYFFFNLLCFILSIIVIIFVVFCNYGFLFCFMEINFMFLERYIIYLYIKIVDVCKNSCYYLGLLRKIFL